MLRAAFAILLTVFFASGCVAQPAADAAVMACKTACNDARAKGENLESGPCLLNPVPAAPEWVCDVAHSPRQVIDNLPENQCSAFGVSAKHFVEVSPNCELIKAV